MWKNALIGVVLLGFAWSYPPTRRPMTNALAPALERLGPAGHWVLEPTRRYDARNEVEFIVEQVQIARTEGRPVPNARTFQEWLRQRVTTKREGKDPWGEPYYLVHVSNTLSVGSTGSDRAPNTGDDIRKTIPF